MVRLEQTDDGARQPRPGDIAAFYDAKLKGKKGLHTYTQHVGSVEEPLVGIVGEFEDRKHKVRVLQVERGVPDEVSYRCEDLKGGKVVVRVRCACVYGRLTDGAAGFPSWGLGGGLYCTWICICVLCCVAGTNRVAHGPPPALRAWAILVTGC